jgi:hypothetical protein
MSRMGLSLLKLIRNSRLLPFRPFVDCYSPPD